MQDALEGLGAELLASRFSLRPECQTVRWGQRRGAMLPQNTRGSL